MSKTTLSSNFAVQLNAGTEYETVTKDGVLHLLIPFHDAAVGGAATESKSAPKETAAPAAATDAPKGRGRRGGAAAAPAEAPEEKAPAASGRRAVRGAGKTDVKAKALEIFKKVESDGDEEAARTELQALGGTDKEMKKQLARVFDEFMSDGDAPASKFAEHAEMVLRGEDPYAEAEGEGSGEGEVVELKDLQEGDLVSVFFKDSEDYEAGDFTGEVIKVAKGRGGKAKVTIAFDPADGETEGDEMDYDPAIMGEIRLLPAEEE